MSAKEWTVLEKGLKQRVRALNMFLRDIYHGREGCAPISCPTT